MTAVNRWVSRHIIKETETENEPGERAGVINKIFGSIYHARLAGKRMKAWNRNAYYTAKYAVIGWRSPCLCIRRSRRQRIQRRSM